jgi:hypothetical protein
MTNVYSGVFEVYSGEKLIDVIHNRITDTMLYHLGSVLVGSSPPNLKIKYLALGSGTGPVSDDITSLVNETFRTQYTEAPRIMQFGVVQTKFVILADEAVGEIKEIGIFAGDAATSTPGSGILISRVPWEYTKTGSDELTIVRTDRIRRG